MIAIVTDSTSDIPPEMASEYGIRVIPAILIVEGVPFEDGVGLSREEFYSLLPGLQTPPTTAAPSSGSIQAVYQDLLAGGVESVVSLHVAASLSGIYAAARIAAKPFGDRVTVIDSGQLSLGLGFQVIAAAEAAAAGGYLDDVLAAVEGTRRRIQVVAMLDTLEYLRRGGRVSLLKAGLGAVLRMRFFIELHEGKVSMLEQVRTRTKALGRLWELVVSLGQVERFAVLHANAEEDAKRLLQRLMPDLPMGALLVNVNTVIGTHVGPGALGFAAVLRK
ncbi:MAG TPA: DegV family protein [Anaerolineales bacterium]|nr:DegV family protein [Anaerolineales bacterium]